MRSRKIDSTILLSGDDFWKVVHTGASITKQFNLVLVEGVTLCGWEGNCGPGRK